MIQTKIRDVPLLFMSVSWTEWSRGNSGVNWAPAKSLNWASFHETVNKIKVNLKKRYAKRQITQSWEAKTRLEQLVENREPLYRGSAFVSTLSGNVHVLFYDSNIYFPLKRFVLFIYQFLFSLFHIRIILTNITVANYEKNVCLQRFFRKVSLIRIKKWIFLFLRCAEINAV